MALKEKLDLFNKMSDEEKNKVKQKFLATLALVSLEELVNILNYLASQGIEITNAKDIKVAANSKAEIAKKFSILGEIKETDIYKQDPGMINRNVIDIYKKIKYCIQIGKSYKREDGTYESFLFSESAWQQEFNKESSMINNEPEFGSLEDSLITITPTDPIVTPEEPTVEESNNPYVDINEFMNVENDMASLEAKTTNFADIREELKNELAKLDGLKSMGTDEIGFADIEPETYGMGRAA